MSKVGCEKAHSLSFLIYYLPCRYGQDVCFDRGKQEVQTCKGFLASPVTWMYGGVKSTDGSTSYYNHYRNIIIIPVPKSRPSWPMHTEPLNNCQAFRSQAKVRTWPKRELESRVQASNLGTLHFNLSPSRFPRFLLFSSLFRIQQRTILFLLIERCREKRDYY